MPRDIVTSDSLPTPVGPFSAAVKGPERVQPVDATPACWSNSRCSLKASAGVLQPRVLRGLVLRA